MTDADLSNEDETRARRDLLAATRGYGQGRDVFDESFPAASTVHWVRAELEPADLARVRHIDYSYWNELSGGSRLPADAAGRIRSGVRVFGVSNQRFLDAADAVTCGRRAGAAGVGGANGWVVTRRFLLHWSRQPESVVLSLLFPVLITPMFGYLFGGAMSVPGGGGLLVLVGCGLAIGWRAHHGVGATALGMLLLLLFRFALLWPGIFLGLTVRGAAAVTALQVLEFPLGFLANTFVSPTTMPAWLGTVAEWNPLSATVSATRELFGNPGYGGESWASTHALLLAVLWPLVITAVFAPRVVTRAACGGPRRATGRRPA